MQARLCKQRRCRLRRYYLLGGRETGGPEGRARTKMKLKAVHIENYRSIKALTLDLDPSSRCSTVQTGAVRRAY